MERTSAKVEKRESTRRGETSERRSEGRSGESERGEKRWGWREVLKRRRCHWKRPHCLPLRVFAGGWVCVVVVLTLGMYIDIVFGREVAGAGSVSYNVCGCGEVAMGLGIGLFLITLGHGPCCANQPLF